MVAIGESSHCNHEFYLLHDRITRYLVQQHGFTAFAAESGFPEGRFVDEWIKGGNADLDRATPITRCRR